MKIEGTLSKENFWNEMKELYPNAMSDFREWLDEYKEAVHWEDLFLVRQRQHYYRDIKFHHIPYAMQMGIWFEYCRKNLHRFFEQSEHPAELFDLAEDIKTVFSEIEIGIVSQQV